MSTKVPRTQTGLIPTTHKNEMNRLASPEAIISLPPKPPPIHYRFKGEKKQSVMTPPLQRRRGTSTRTRNEWNSSLVENRMYMNTSNEIRKKEKCKNAVQDFLRSSAKKRQQLDILEKRLNDEIESERKSTDSLSEDMNQKDDEEHQRPSDPSVESQFVSLRRSLVSRLQCHEESLTGKIDSNDTFIESSTSFQSEWMTESPNHTTIDQTKSNTTATEETSFDSSWEILPPEQRCRIQKRMKQIYMSKYSHKVGSQYIKDSFHTNVPFDTNKIGPINKAISLAVGENERHDEDPAATTSSSLNDKSYDTDNCVSSLIESIANGFQMDFIEHVTALKGDLAYAGNINEVKTPERSPLTEQPEHPYSLPLSDKYKQSILQENSSDYL